MEHRVIYGRHNLIIILSLSSCVMGSRGCSRHHPPMVDVASPILTSNPYSSIITQHHLALKFNVWRLRRWLLYNENRIIKASTTAHLIIGSFLLPSLAWWRRVVVVLHAGVQMGLHCDDYVIAAIGR